MNTDCPVSKELCPEPVQCEMRGCLRLDPPIMNAGRSQTTDEDWTIDIMFGPKDADPETLLILIEKTIWNSYPGFSGVIAIRKEPVTNG